jgi:RNA polymerase sigma-70 factor (TIGR02957 family)
VINEAELRRLTPDERRQLARTLAAIDRPHPLIDPKLRRRRRFGLLFMTACCVGLAVWIAILILTLPGRYTSHDWRGVWVGLDIAELAGFAATAWAAWNQRQVIIFLMIITGTLLVCDAWFDVALDYHSRGFTTSLVSALVVELPLALLLFTSARRLVRFTIQTMMQLSGVAGPVPPLWRIPLFAHGLEEALPARFRPRPAEATADVRADVTAAGGSSSLGSDDPEGRTVDPSDYTEYRPLMFSIAYRMTGSVSDAEDIVQEAFLRTGKDADIESPKAYLATITTRLAIDHLRSARVRRESYVGTWLPEPLIGSSEPDPAELAETSDSLSMAFLVLLESLAPAERAVFLLREVFGYGYGEIAEALGKTEAACRQIFTRARRRIDDGRPRFETSRAEGEELTSLFLAAADGGDMTSLIERLAPDVLFYGDSGGLGEVTFIAPVFGREQVAELIRVQVERTLRLGASLRPATVNGRPGVLACDADGGLIAVIAFDVLDGQVQAIRVVANPEKLRHIGPVSRTWHLRWRDHDEENEEN